MNLSKLPFLFINLYILFSRRNQYSFQELLQNGTVCKQMSFFKIQSNLQIISFLAFKMYKLHTIFAQLYNCVIFAS